MNEKFNTFSVFNKGMLCAGTGYMDADFDTCSSSKSGNI